jgi:hypothetical protein
VAAWSGGGGLVWGVNMEREMGGGVRHPVGSGPAMAHVGSGVAGEEKWGADRWGLLQCIMRGEGYSNRFNLIQIISIWFELDLIQTGPSRA